MSRPATGTRQDTRAAVLDAARAEFAACGYEGAGVDRIARRARVNKAMLYYHFGSKQALYRHVVRDMLQAVTAATAAATAAATDPTAKLRAFVGALLEATTAQPHFVPILLRELADGGRHLDADTLRIMPGLFGVVRDVLEQGWAGGEFRAADPLLTYFTIAGTTMFYVANRPIRERLHKLKALPPSVAVPIGSEVLERHMATVLRRTLDTRSLED